MWNNFCKSSLKHELGDMGPKACKSKTEFVNASKTALFA
jgi:hypothetical protein